MNRLRLYLENRLRRWLPRIAPGAFAWWAWCSFALERWTHLTAGGS